MAVVELKLPEVDVPDVSKLDLPKVDLSGIDMTRLSNIDMGKARDRLGKAQKSVSRAQQRAASRQKDMSRAVADALPRRSGPSPLPFVVVGLLAGMAIGYWLATSEFFAPRVKEAVDQVRSRVSQGPSTTDDLSGFEDTQQRQPLTGVPVEATDETAPEQQGSYAF